MSTTTPLPTVTERHRNWVFGWEREHGDGRFEFRETFRDFYDWESEDVILYDDFDPEHRVARSPREYGAIWDVHFNHMRSVAHVIVDGPAVIEQGDLAASRLVFVARLEPLLGEVTGIRTTTSLVWRRTEGRWRIVREHNSTVVIPVHEAEEALGGPRGRESTVHVRERETS